jgi:hypothetical protein
MPPMTLTLRGGSVIDLRDPDMSLINIEMVAHALSQICRFSGHCNSFYSVAQHSVIIAYSVASARGDLALPALLHDASEAFLNDLTRALKHSPEMKPYRDLEANFQARLLMKFGCHPEMDPLIKAVDVEVGERERRALVLGQEGVILPVPVAPSIAKAMFLNAYERFTWGKMRPTSLRTH